MSELELFFLVLALIYVWECAGWLPRGVVAFRTWLGRQWRVTQPSSLLGNARGGIHFNPPFPPLGTVLRGIQFPLSLSEDAALAFVASSVNPGGRAPQTARLLRFEELQNVQVNGKQVRVGVQLLLQAASPNYAIHLAEQLRHLSTLPIAKRKQAIRELLEQSFDSVAIQKRWADFQEKSAGLTWLTNGLVLYLFGLAPLLIWQLGLPRTWLGLLIGLLGLTTATAIRFGRAHKALYPAGGEERFTQFITVWLSPASSARARDLLSRSLLENFHPLAVASVFCAEADFRNFARQILVELAYPALPLCPCEEPLAIAAESSWRAASREQVERLLRRKGLVPANLLQPPPADPGCLSYCPRCQAQFTTPEGVCSDCGGVSLEKLKENGRSQSQP